MAGKPSILERAKALSANVKPSEKTDKPRINELIAPEGVAPGAFQIASRVPLHEKMGRARPKVPHSADLDRIVAIPRRPPMDLDVSRNIKAEALVELMTRRLSIDNPNCDCPVFEGRKACITRLLPAQAWALYEAPMAGGLLGPIGVGHGKTGLDILMAMVMPNVRTAVLLIPPGLRGQLLRDYHLWEQHFRVPSLMFEDRSGAGAIKIGVPTVRVLPYSLFSRPESTSILEQLRPDLIIADEAQKLRDLDTATASRFFRYFVNRENEIAEAKEAGKKPPPHVRFCGWSGTLTANSIRDYAHLSALALRETSPLPLDPEVVDQWALALDPLEWEAPPGALLKLCKPLEHVRSGFHRRLVDTKGVVATKEGAIDASIIMHERDPGPMPYELGELLETLRDSDNPDGWVRPDGEELVDVLEVARVASELACGFFYRWKFPRGEPPELIARWRARRAAWNKELREKLKARAEHLDSPKLCENAARRAYQSPPYEGELPVWKAVTWPAWAEIEDQVYHETEAVWLDEKGKGFTPIEDADYLVRDAAAWARKHKGIVWYEHEAVGRRIAEISGLPLHGGGPGAEARILAETGKRSIIASISAHGTGRDGLQRIFRHQLIANLPSSGATWEQLLGRLHRIGQPADEVETWVYRHAPEFYEPIDKAIRKAKYIEGTMGTEQKLLRATLTFDLER